MPPQPWGRIALILLVGCDSYPEARRTRWSRRRGKERAPARPGECARRALFGDDVDGEGDVDVGVQFHRDLGRAELLERLGELGLAPVELDARLRAHRVDDVRRRDRSEQAAFLAGSGSDLDPPPGQLVGEGLSTFAIARVP